MPYRRTVKVSDDVYERLMELTRKHNLESPNQLLEKLLAQGVTPSESDRVTLSERQAQQNKRVTPPQPQGVTPSEPDRVTLSVEVRRRDYMWWTIRVGEGWDAIETDLNIIQLMKLCQAKLLAREVCEKVQSVK
jgi:predicted CopG family antitoxin